VFVEPVEGHRIDPYDLAVDPYGRMVYWTDTEHKVIAVTRTDGENIGTVVDDVDARSIALAPEEGFVYFCLFILRRRRRLWHATHDCVAPYVDIILHRGRF